MLPFQKLDQEFFRKADLYKVWSFVAMGLFALYVIIQLLILCIFWKFKNTGEEAEYGGNSGSG